MACRPIPVVTLRISGVGIMANLAIAPFIGTPGAVDYLAVTPDMFWIDHGLDGGEGRRFTDIPSWVAMLEASGLPMVSHHIGLSIASATRPTPPMLRKWRPGANVGVRIG